MDWTDEALILSVSPHGETAARVEVLARIHGRHAGLVHGGRSRKLRPVLQLGNHVDVVWRARLSEQLGAFTVELRRGYAAAAMADAGALAALSSLSAMARLLPERDPVPNLYEISLFVLGFIEDPSVWPALYVRWELALLEALGFGLDLATCAVTGRADDLAFVSPRSGRAVSREAGSPYEERLLALPAFLRPGRADVSAGNIAAEVRDGLALTGHFLETRVLAPRELEMPEARRRLASMLARRAG